jgi:DNA-binding GntR family transcriptional regulator
LVSTTTSGGARWLDVSRQRVRQIIARLERER